MKKRITAGDTYSFQLSPHGYYPGDGWELKVRMVPVDAEGTVIDLKGVAQGEVFSVLVKPQETKAWLPGLYNAVAWLERGDDSIFLFKDCITVDPDPRQITPGYDGRSLAKRTLDDLLSAKALYDTSKGGIQKYKIADREIEYRSSSEILTAIRFWRRIVEIEEQKDGSRDKKRPNRILVKAAR